MVSGRLTASNQTDHEDSGSEDGLKPIATNWSASLILLVRENLLNADRPTSLHIMQCITIKADQADQNLIQPLDRL